MHTQLLELPSTLLLIPQHLMQERSTNIFHNVATDLHFIRILPAIAEAHMYKMNTSKAMNNLIRIFRLALGEEFQHFKGEKILEYCLFTGEMTFVKFKDLKSIE